MMARLRRWLVGKSISAIGGSVGIGRDNHGPINIILTADNLPDFLQKAVSSFIRENGLNEASLQSLLKKEISKLARARGVSNTELRRILKNVGETRVPEKEIVSRLIALSDELKKKRVETVQLRAEVTKLRAEVIELSSARPYEQNAVAVTGSELQTVESNGWHTSALSQVITNSSVEIEFNIRFNIHLGFGHIAFSISSVSSIRVMVSVSGLTGIDIDRMLQHQRLIDAERPPAGGCARVDT